MSDVDDTQMAEAGDDSSHPDDAQSEGTMMASRPKAANLRPRALRDIDESGADYAPYFRSLQIKPQCYDRFLTGVINVIRHKHMPDLKRGTDLSIRGLTSLVLRGFGYIVWTRDAAHWLIEDAELEADEERLVHVKGGERNGESEHFYPLLEPIWWKMRDTMFEIKPPPKPRRSGSGRGTGTNTYQQDAYEADNDTELDTRAPSDRSRDQTLKRIDRLIAKTPEPWRPRMMANETDEAILDIMARLAQTRANSSPDIFARLWEQHVTRADELEAPAVSQTLYPTFQLEATATSNHAYFPELNLSNEPFATHGNPVPQGWPRPFLPQVPAVMSVFITTSPPESPYTQQAYHWLDAPVRLVDQISFFERLLLRVKMKAHTVKGFVFSYGWCDIARWVTMGEERDGWGVFQDDVARAADMGVRTWRMKVLVVGK